MSQDTKTTGRIAGFAPGRYQGSGVSPPHDARMRPTGRTAVLAALLDDLCIFPSDLEMLVEDHGGDNAAPGPDQRIVALARVLREACRG